MDTVQVLRDPIWQGIGAIVAILALLLFIYVEREKLFQSPLVKLLIFILAKFLFIVKWAIVLGLIVDIFLVMFLIQLYEVPYTLLRVGGYPVRELAVMMLPILPVFVSIVVFVLGLRIEGRFDLKPVNLIVALVWSFVCGVGLAITIIPVVWLWPVNCVRIVLC